MTVYTQQYQQKLEHMQDMLLHQEGVLINFTYSFSAISLDFRPSEGVQLLNEFCWKFYRES